MSSPADRATLAGAAAELVDAARFDPVRGTDGYDMSQVDPFLDDIIGLISMGYPIEDPVVTVRFRPTRFREGYNAGQVDDLLDTLVALVSAGVSPEAVQPPSGDGAIPTSRTAARAGGTLPEGGSGLPSVIEEKRGLLSRLFSRGD